MLPGFANGKAVAEMQQEISGLRQQLASLSEQIAALASQSATEAKRSLSATSDIEALRQGRSEMDDVARNNSSTLASQSDELDRLGRRMDRYDETLRNIQGTLSRMEKQATADLEEIRSRDASMMALVSHWSKASKDA